MYYGDGDKNGDFRAFNAINGAKLKHSLMNWRVINFFARDGILEFLYTSNGRDSRQEIPWHLNKTN